MANPNIVSVASIYGFSVSGAITTSDVDIINVTAEEIDHFENIVKELI